MSGSEALDEARALAEAQRRGLAHATGHADVFMDGAVWAFAEQAATIQNMREALEAVRREAGRALVRTPSGPEALALGNIRHVADAALAAVS